MMDNDTAPLERSKKGTPGSLCGRVVCTSACPRNPSESESVSCAVMSDASSISLQDREEWITSPFPATSQDECLFPMTQ